MDDTNRHNRYHHNTTTRTSPFGYYATCSCGWVSAPYRTDAEQAYWDLSDHIDQARAEDLRGPIA